MIKKKYCDNSTRKIHISNNAIFSVSFLVMFGTLLLHCNTPLHFTTLRYTSPHVTQLHFTTLRYTSPHFTQLHFTILRYTSPNYTLLHFATLHPTTLHYTSLHHTSLHHTSPNYTSLPLIYTSLPSHLTLGIYIYSHV